MEAVNLTTEASLTLVREQVLRSVRQAYMSQKNDQFLCCMLNNSDKIEVLVRCATYVL